MNILFLSCLKATEMIEKKLHFSLSLKEKYQLKMHRMMCDACRRYDKQTNFIENSLKNQNHIPKNEVDVEKLKQLIHEKIKN
jgi:hypothetical protein